MHQIVRRTATALSVLAAAVSLSAPAAAQSDILLRLRSGSPAGDRFRVDSAGGVVAVTQLGIGIIPATGSGWRMMWYPFKAAFRAGGVDGAGTQWNDANIGFYSWAGGHNTIATAFGSFSFGDAITVSGTDATGFGNASTISGTAGFSAGASNLCSGFGCTTIGFTNTATGQGSVAIGYRVTADADYAVALGHRASANGRTGAFVIGDQSTTDSIEASANNQFSARYAGGYRLYTNATTTTGMQLAAGGSSWTVISDRNRKQDFLAVDGESILNRVRALPVSTWRYRDEEDRTTFHIGPMAQDWHLAFGFTTDDGVINMSDFDGVNLAAIQALEARTTHQARQLEAQEARLAAQAQQIEAARAENAELRARLDRLEARMEGKP